MLHVLDFALFHFVKILPFYWISEAQFMYVIKY